VRGVASAVAAAAGAGALAASAAAVGGNRLAFMPLPKEALGPEAARFVLVSDSGVDTNADAARHAGRGATAAGLARAGRITGYTLDYALPPSVLRQPPRLLGVQTIAELYRDGPTARAGLRFWRGVTRALRASRANGVTVRLAPFTARVGDGAFAYELTYRRPGAAPVYVGDVVFRTGDLLGALFVTASDEAGLRGRTTALARRLEARMRLVAGRR
jgi:hypothetical protein